MKKIIKNPRVQTLISILIIFGAYIVSTLQGIFGIVFPFVLLTFFILMIVFVYYIAIVPVVEILKPESFNSERIYSLERIRGYETTADLKEIWIITSNMIFAFDKKGFEDVIRTNIKRGIKYKFFINDNNIAKERAIEMKEIYEEMNDLFEVYFIKEDLPFVDHNTDYDLFFTNDQTGNKGFIGITIDEKREYVCMSQDMFIKLKLFITNLQLERLEF